MSVLRAPLKLSREAYQNLVRRLDGGELHPTLIGGEKWYPPDEQDQLAARADAELQRVGWRSRDFADVVTLLQRPAVDHYCWARISGRDVTLQAASQGRDAVLAVADDETVHLFPSSAETAAWDLATALPDTPPVARMHSLSCSEEDYTAVLAGDAPPSRTNSARDARRAAEWMQLPRVHVGRLYAAVRSGGKRIRNETPPYWIDTEQGRFIASVSEGWLSVAAASAQDVAHRLQRLESDLRSQ
ncbi:ESX secretion-associated protein EspG [Amycolatopsis sp. NBC_01480]|uniref:ESX secretion-associated protein EspG n=1 Tax=Amycolatopsis sp. NBC_01480 TaxID=2903562 RepID=UPI002E2C51F2|nr:ESX secretion-associated protein EspG [Amycolatopsis sp. NBC_01480]